MCVCSIPRVAWVKDGLAEPSLLGRFVKKPLEYRRRAPVCSIEDVTSCDPCIRGSCHGSASHRMCFECGGFAAPSFRSCGRRHHVYCVIEIPCTILRITHTGVRIRLRVYGDRRGYEPAVFCIICSECCAFKRYV